MYSLVMQAANVLNVSEHRLFELAHRHWHQAPANPALIDRALRDFRQRAVLPSWVLHFARSVVRAYRAGNFEPAVFGVYPDYDVIPLPWALAFRSPTSVPVDNRQGIFIA